MTINPMAPASFVLLLLAMAITLPASAIAQQSFLPEINPSPEYQPEEVVGIQMRALANNDRPFDNAGIELTFRFASPRNKSSTGPLERFARLFSNPAYQPMLDQHTLQIGDPEVRGNRARVPVMIETASGRRIAYLFILSLQKEGPYLDCWMTDGVTPVRVSDSDTPVTM